jgi:hypothetical protein
MKSEAAIQQKKQLEESKKGARLWRNNVGAYSDDYGNYIRYGLCNESKAVNQLYKSSDLIGITPVLITPDMVGQTIGVFTAYECKKEGWKFKPNNKHEQAQLNFINLVVSMGGIGAFINE